MDLCYYVAILSSYVQLQLGIDTAQHCCCVSIVHVQMGAMLGDQLATLQAFSNSAEQNSTAVV